MPPMIAIPVHHRELLGNLVRREIRGRYKGSALGVVWTLVTPLVMMGAYTLVFRVIFRTGPEIPNYPLFLLTGLMLWVLFGNSLVVAASSLLANGNLIKKVRFPRVIVPLAAVSSQLPTIAVMLAALIPFNLWQMPAGGDRRTMLLVPVVLLATLMMVLGLCFAVSVVNVLFRDLQYIIDSLLLPWFFITPILYTFKTFPVQSPTTIDLLKVLNFVTPYMLAIQDTMYWGRWPSAGLLAYLFVVGAVFLVGGLLIFNRLQRDLAVEL
jgi:lipopolysaccharide transport system permease protein